MSGKVFLSDPDIITRECAAGLAIVYPELIQNFPNSYNERAVMRVPIDPDRVNIIVSSGGGGGPFSPSLVMGPDLADAAICGNIATAPSAFDIYEVAKRIDSKKGYVLIYNNFMGDCLNNDLALELLQNEGYRGCLFPVCDDFLSVGDDATHDERTGLIGIAMIVKAASAFAKTGVTLEEMEEFLKLVGTRLSSVMCTLDFDKRLTLFGEGISGEPATRVFEDAFSLRDIARLSYDFLMDDIRPTKDEKLYVSVSRSHHMKFEDAFILSKYMKEYAEGRHPIEMMSAGYFDCISEADGFTTTMLAADARIEPYVRHRCFTDSFIL